MKYLNIEYGDLEPYETNKHPDYIFFTKNGEIIFEYDKEDGTVFISLDNIWSFLENFFELEETEILSLTKKWIEVRYKLNVESVNLPHYLTLKLWKSIENS
jgi:hypothetical protein